jgi:hypothetical protein
MADEKEPKPTTIDQRSSLPSFADKNRLITELKSIDLRTVDVDFIFEQLRPVFDGYVVKACIFDAGMPLYRGNVYPQQPMNRSFLTYPPVALVDKFQRANRPGRPMFYCSGARPPPFFELGVRSGDHISISRWRTTERALLNNIGYDQPVFDMLKSTRTADIYKYIMPELDDGFDPTNDNYIVHTFLAKEFAHRIAVGEEHQYKLSAAIAEWLLGKDVVAKPGEEWKIEKLPPYRKFCGIMYPALAMSANADNIALRPEFVDNYLKLEQVEYLRIDEVVEPQRYKYTFVDFANSFATDGTIQWNLPIRLRQGELGRS